MFKKIILFGGLVCLTVISIAVIYTTKIQNPRVLAQTLNQDVSSSSVITKESTARSSIIDVSIGGGGVIMITSTNESSNSAVSSTTASSSVTSQESSISINIDNTLQTEIIQKEQPQEQEQQISQELTLPILYNNYLDYSIKEEGVKIVDKSSQNSLDISIDAKEKAKSSSSKTITTSGGGFETDNHREIGSNISSSSVDENCRKGWDGTVKGNYICDQVCGGNSLSSLVLTDSNQKVKELSNLPRKNDDCYLPKTGLQSGSSSNNIFTKFLPLWILIGLGVAGSLGYKFFSLSTHAHKPKSFVEGETSDDSNIFTAKGTPQDLHFSKKYDNAPPVIHNKVSMQDMHIDENIDVTAKVWEPVGNNCPAGGNRAINTKGAGSNIGVADTSDVISNFRRGRPTVTNAGEWINDTDNTATKGVSNTLKTKHDTVKNSVSNIR
jgi:hypothetical protein